MLADFRKFIARGNVLDMAVGIIIGAAFTTVVKSLVDDIIMPPIGKLTGGVDFSNMFVTLGSGQHYESLKAAKDAGAATINYGLFLNNVISFLIVAFAVFMIVRAASKMQKPAPAMPVGTPETECPHCMMKIPAAATRCPHCTSQLTPAHA